MKIIVLSLLVTLAACGHTPVKFSAPDPDAPVFDLNQTEWPGTNDLIHPPGRG